ncbi:hypothetical protein CL2_26720 [Anaerostipes hadrus]|uniref:Uncharacterized protein n=1 Tax=Anaerostipes hadrus TaxID=649756 RepID=D4MVS7_ANAHA|nr:hypothetical protein CL2_26720 [Anaerostipes hadrus]
MIPRRAQGANKDMIMRLLHGHGGECSLS